MTFVETCDICGGNKLLSISVWLSGMTLDNECKCQQSKKETMEYYKDTNGDVWCCSKLGITAKVFTLDHIDAECNELKLAGLTMPNGVHYRDLPIKDIKIK